MIRHARDGSDAVTRQLIEQFSGCSTFEEAWALIEREKGRIRDYGPVLEGLAECFERKGDAKQLRHVYRRIGDVYVQFSGFDRAKEWYAKALSIPEDCP